MRGGVRINYQPLPEIALRFRPSLKGRVIYLNPFARQQASAAARQSLNSRAGFRKSRQGCQPLHSVRPPRTSHRANLRRRHCSFEICPVTVVHCTTIFWFNASPVPSSCDDTNWNASAAPIERETRKRKRICFFIYQLYRKNKKMKSEKLMCHPVKLRSNLCGTPYEIMHSKN